MGEAATTKTCRICNEDCSDRPSIKEPKGSYVCRSCLAAAAELLSSRRSRTRETTDESLNLITPDPREELEFLPATHEILDEVIEAPEVAPAPPSDCCPHCHTRFRLHSFICVECGYDRRYQDHHAGIRTNPNVKGDPSDPDSQQASWTPETSARKSATAPASKPPWPFNRGIFARSDAGRELPLVADFGRYFQEARHKCQKCRGVVEIRRRLPDRRWQLMLTLITLGLWLPIWFGFEIACRIMSWRCTNCRGRVRRSLID